MANTRLANSGTVTSFGEMLPIDPFRSLYVHFGMLLGVEDFRTLDAYHRGKQWLHAAWLHRQGVIWGLGVHLDAERNEVRVAPGLALDALGRELYLQQAACLNLGAWYEQHKDDAELAEIITEDDEGAVSFSAHVILTFKACLSRQVPALTEPCDGSNATTAYSRVVENVELLLVPGPAPAPGPLPYHRVRLLFALEAAHLDEEGAVTDSDQEVLDARAAVLALPADQQPAGWLQWLRHFSCYDAMDLTPAQVEEGEDFALFPGSDPSPLPLANLSITLMPADTGWTLDPETVTPNAVDNSIRPVLLPTTTIQELVCGPQPGGGASGSVSPPPPPLLPDAGGPRIDPASVQIDGELIHFTIAGGPLMKASVDTRAVSVTAFDNRDGWVTADIKKVSYDETASRVEVELRDAPGGNLVRLIVKGSGPTPFLGRNRVPLAGAVGGAAGTQTDGNDFVSMVRIRS